jgi:aldehyde dehydrogenase (NAD+)
MTRTRTAPGRSRPTKTPDTWYESVSPVTGETLARVQLPSAAEIAALFDQTDPNPAPLPATEVFAFLGRFQKALTARREELLSRTLLETGFIAADCLEMIDGTIEFLRDFETHVSGDQSDERRVPHSYAGRRRREMRIARRPYHTVAALVPQNASLPLAVTIVASVLYAGSRLVLRPSLQCAHTSELLASLIRESDPPAGAVKVVTSLAKDFVGAACASRYAEIIHYIGSNQHALDVFTRAFEARKICLLDGQGNGFAYVDDGFPTAEAVRLLAAGATRFNGETCTSVNGVMVHPSRYPELREALVSAFQALRLGHPADPTVHVGPLLSRGQAEGLAATLHGRPPRRLLCGGLVEGAYFAPAVVEGVSLDDPVVTEGIFGPAVWVHPVAEKNLFDWLHGNRFPLSDAILSLRPDLIRRFACRSRAARICVNQDPSIESMFEPWGGYPPSGYNLVSDWVDKYRQPYQLDGTPIQLAELSSPDWT